jgi:hypothetical protein
MPAAAPFILNGALGVGSTIAGHYAGKSAAAGAMNRSPEEQQAINQSLALGRSSAQLGQQFSSLALPRISQGLNYYGTLLGGNRAAIRGAVSPELQDIGEAYKGADVAIGRGYMQGGQRDQALAENARAKAGQISRLIGGVRPMAAQGISQLGLGAAGIGQQQQYVSGLLNQGVAQQGFQNRLLGQRAGADAAAQWGGLFARLSASLSGVKFGKKPPVMSGGGGGGYDFSKLPGYGTKLPGVPGLPVEDFS